MRTKKDDPEPDGARPLAPQHHHGLGRHPGLHELYGLTVPEGGPEPYMRETWRGGINKRNTGPESTRAETEHITKAAAKS